MVRYFRIALAVGVLLVASLADARDWAYVGGLTGRGSGTYGTQGVASALNLPPPRQAAATWRDAAGNLWLFGGRFTDSGPDHNTNDLWKYDVTTHYWTWIGGSSAVDLPGVYGVKGTADPANIPGARSGASYWKDACGNFWLFGGELTAGQAYNDLWKYDIVTNQWTWMSGSNVLNQTGVYGGGLPSTANIPGARSGSSFWSDASGKLWLFGGTIPPGNYINDLWTYNTATNEWTWLKGSTSVGQPGVYGVQSTPADSNTPGARSWASAWPDGSGNVWVFGGLGWGASASGELNDLWKLNMSTLQWTWMKGSTGTYQCGVYGMQGTPADVNTPGARRNAAYWLDAAGDLVLFGGDGCAATNDGMLNDLWKYSVSTNQWTWVKGSNGTGPASTYGTQGLPAAANTPGGRGSASVWTDGVGRVWFFGGWSAVTVPAADTCYGVLNDLWTYDIPSGNWAWVGGNRAIYPQGGIDAPAARYRATMWHDNAGNLWLFGGGGDAGYGPTTLNDLWKYNIAAGKWSIVRGTTETTAFGVYGTMGVPADANTPGDRLCAMSWTDTSGNLWLFGGTGLAGSSSGDLNDLWKYNTATNQWTWMKGNNTPSQAGVGQLGIASDENTPGARYAAACWTDNSGNLWLYGGSGRTDGGSGLNGLSDFWKYDVAANQWILVKGSDASAQLPVYGTQGSPDPANTPGERQWPATWKDKSGDLWLFGGRNDYPNQAFSDLWRYNIASGNWTWVKGSSLLDQSSVFGTAGEAAPENLPGAAYETVSWMDPQGNFWMFGGFGFHSTDAYGVNLWKYDVAAGNWTWLNGIPVSSPTFLPVYGVQGIPSAGNTPSFRIDCASCSGDQGQMWLFGGVTLDQDMNLAIGMDLWRLTVAPPATPGATAITTESITWTWSDNSISESGYEVLGDQGTANPTTLTTTTAENATSWTMTELSPNTQYSFRVAATPDDDISKTDVFSTWTLAAVPAAPLLSSPIETALKVAIASGDGNPTDTQYAVYCTTISRWVKPDGGLADSPVWATASDWSTCTVAGLTPRTAYSFLTRARNGAQIETTNGAAAEFATAPVTLSGFEVD